MLHVEIDQESGQHALVSGGGEKILLRDDVWSRLRDAQSIFSEWKQFLQKWSIHVGKAPLLKAECPTDAEYRTLRTVIRTFDEPKA